MYEKTSDRISNKGVYKSLVSHCLVSKRGSRETEVKWRFKVQTSSALIGVCGLLHRDVGGCCLLWYVIPLLIGARLNPEFPNPVGRVSWSCCLLIPNIGML